MVCGKQCGRPSNRNEPARNIKLRSGRPDAVVEEQACSEGADDTQAKIQQKTVKGAAEEPARETASGKADHDEDDS